MRKISCIMATMNRHRFIRESVDSILKNEYLNTELIIIDSGESIKNLLPEDNRIVYLQAPNASCTEAMNIGMKKSTGDILAMTNDDDLLKSDTLSFIDENLKSEWGYGKVDRIDEKGNLISHESLFSWNYEKLKYGNKVPQPAAFWTRKIFLEFGVLDTTVNFANDFEFWMRIGAKYKPQTFDKVLAEFRVHDKAISSERLHLQRKDASTISKRYKYRHAEYENFAIKTTYKVKDFLRKNLKKD